MASTPTAGRPRTPPYYTTFSARGVIAPSFSAFKPRDVRVTVPTTPNNRGSLSHIAWNCDGRRLSSAGYEKAVRLWQPDKSLDPRNTTTLSGAHTEAIDFVTWNPTHPDLLCSSSSRDKRVAFYDARQSRPTQVINTSRRPVSLQYAPDGKSLMLVDEEDRLMFLKYGHTGTDNQAEWKAGETARSVEGGVIFTSLALWNHVGDGIFANSTEGGIRILSYPDLRIIGRTGAHVRGLYAAALDPRGKYLITGGAESIINFFDLDEWLCIRTMAVGDTSVSSLSFSYDGEYIACAMENPFIDIIATETGQVMHRIPSMTVPGLVTWHPSKHIVASCGEGGASSRQDKAWLSVFGPGIS